MDDALINKEFMYTHSIPPQNILAAELTPVMLKERGFTSPSMLTSVGFDSLHLVNTAFCESCIEAYGAQSVVHSFITRPIDAVCISGSGATSQLGIGMEQLLVECAGETTEAAAVVRQMIEQIGVVRALEGVTAKTLLDTGLRAKALIQVGLDKKQIVASIVPSPQQMIKLGYA